MNFNGNQDNLLNHCWFFFLVRLCVRSLGAHSACQLPTADIWKAWERATNSFHSVQQGTIVVRMGTRNILWVSINADEVTWMLVAMICRHQVPMVLLGPSRWTVISCRHHQHGTTWLDIADNTRCIMVMEISLKGITVIPTDFILRAIYVSRALMAIFVLVILWIVWKAKIIWSSSDVIVMFSTNYT